MGVDRDAVQRAQKIAALPPQAKKIARDLGLADNQSALLKAAKSEDKVSALQQYVKRRRHTPEELAQTRANAAQPPRDQAQQRTRNAPETLDRVASLLIDALGDRIAGLIPDLQTITTTALANALRERRPDLFTTSRFKRW